MQKRITKGFTLMEVLVVASIVIMLATFSFPLFRSFIREVKVAEAKAALGVMRTALRIDYAENGGVYNRSVKSGDPATEIPRINADDLDGAYFHVDNYLIDSITTTSFLLKATGPVKSDLSKVIITLDEKGVFRVVGP